MKKSTINHMLPRYYKDYDVDILLDKAYKDRLSEEEHSILREVYMRYGEQSKKNNLLSKYHKGYNIDELCEKAINKTITNAEKSILNEVYTIYPKLIFKERNPWKDIETNGGRMIHVNPFSLHAQAALSAALATKQFEEGTEKLENKDNIQL